MWNKNDWICLSVSAVAAFGISLAALYPSGANAGDPAPAAIQSPTLEIDGVYISATAIKTGYVVEGKNFTFLIKPGLLPNLELRADNNTRANKTVEFSTSIITSRIPSFASRVVMVTASPKSQWTRRVSFDLKPGERKTISISTDVTLAPMSSATLTLEAGSQKVDALTISSAPLVSVRAAFSASPTTKPVNDAEVLNKTAQR
jgi:hypothetical protein